MKWVVLRWLRIKFIRNGWQQILLGHAKWLLLSAICEVKGLNGQIA